MLAVDFNPGFPAFTFPYISSLILLKLTSIMLLPGIYRVSRKTKNKTAPE